MNEQTLELQIQATSKEAVNTVNKLISLLTNVDKNIGNINNKINTSNSSIKTASKTIDSVKSSTDKATNSANKLGNAFKNAFTFTGVKSITKKLLGWMDEAIDYTEQLNLFNVVFDNIEKNGTKTFSNLGLEATKFQNKLNEAFGTNKTETLYMQGIYQSMGETVGIDDTYSAIMSETMTKLTYDLASLYNKSEDTVAEALRAGVYAGQTKPMRSYGIDVTQTTLQPILDSLGIDEQVKNLSQAEKEILRYIATLKQASVSMGDFANNLESPSNQLKIFKQQLVEAKVALSSLFIGTFAKILPYANAFLMVVKEVSTAIATMFGIELTDYNTGIASQESIYDGIADSADDATDSIKKLKRQTLGFDEIHNISENKDSNSSTSGGIDQRLLDAITGYDNGMDKVKMKATEIRDKIMEWLGFTKEIDPLTGDVSFKLKEGYSNLKLIGGIITTLVGMKLIKGITGIITGTSKLSKILGTGGLYKTITSIVGVIKNANFATLGTSLVSFATGPIGIAIGAIAALTGAFIYAYNTNDIFKTKVQNTVSSLKVLFDDLFNAISNVCQQIWEVVEPVWSVIKDTVIAVVKSIYEYIVLKFSLILDTITGTCNIISDLMHGDFKQAFEDSKQMVANWVEDWKNYFSKIKEIFGDLINNIINSLSELVPKIINKLTEIVTWIKELPNKFFYYAGLAVGTLWKVITETDWLSLGKKILTGIVNGIKNIGMSLWNFGSSLFTKIGESIKSIDWKQLGLNILDGIISGMFNFGKKLKGWGTSFVNGIKDALGIHSPAKLVIDAKVGNYTTEGIIVGMKNEVPKLKGTANYMISEVGKTFARGDYDIPLNYNIPSNLPNLNTDCSIIQEIVVNGMAQALSQYGNQSSEIDVHVHTDEGTVIDRIEQRTKQTGKFPLTIPTY